MTCPTIVLFHQNLRIADNRALSWAAKRGPVIPLYIFDDQDGNPHSPGGASRWWLRESLRDLDQNLQKLGVKLILRRGSRVEILRKIIKSTNANAVSWNRRYEPVLAAADTKLEKALKIDGIETASHDGFLLFAPESIRTGSGTPFKVYTPFSKACLAASAPPPPVAAPKQLTDVTKLESENLDDWRLVPHTASWPDGLAADWIVSEAAAHGRLADFIDEGLATYKSDRDRPDIDGTSRLSPYLHYGQLSPHQVWQALHKAATHHAHYGSSIERYRLELLWREFSWHLLDHFPELPDKPLTPSFKNFPWLDNGDGFNAWKKGQTGYPLIDAGMRQLWQTGWMHNRVRMIVASFLIKDLLIDWREGEAWFWDTLVDADLGNNAASWQWVAGCGADAAPFFRIFNPTLQGRKFDPSGAYVRRFVPELAQLDPQYIHEPWKAPMDVLDQAGIKLGKNYPMPIIDHDKARKRALSVLKSLKDPHHQSPETADLFG